MTHLRLDLQRRELMISVLSTAIAPLLPRLGAAASRGTVSSSTDAAANPFSTLLARFAEEMLQLAPERASLLGLDAGIHGALKSRLSDASPQGEVRWAAQVKSMLARLGRVHRAQLSAAEQIHFDAVKHAATMGMEGTQFSFGGARSGVGGGTAPYPVSQQDGAVLEIPEFLDTKHRIQDAADAEAYLERVEAFARVLDQETHRLTALASQGVMPPKFVADKALALLMHYRKTPIAAQKLVTSLVSRTKVQSISGPWETRATTLVERSVFPALDRQIAAFARATANAPDTAGVDRLPDGAAYYRWALRLGTTSEMTANEIHALGIEQNKLIQARMDSILKTEGMSQGSVGERVQALNKDPRMLYSDTDQGRDDLIAYCNDRVAKIRTLLPQFSHLALKAPLKIKRVPIDIQDGAALGYMNFASLDGTRPAIYYINLKSTTLWPKYQIPTLTAHEGVPGHTWQGAYLAEHHAEIPLIASLIGFNAFVEGWALYAEQSVDELGLYEDDPLGRVGYLQAQQFRACRMVVDTGLHALHWTREQAIDFLVSETGKGRNAMTSEVDRYCVAPGQACGYKMGHNEILKQRDRARAALGARFDVAAFNDTLVKTGGVPLTVLPAVVDQFLAATA